MFVLLCNEIKAVRWKPTLFTDPVGDQVESVDTRSKDLRQVKYKQTNQTHKIRQAAPITGELLVRYKDWGTNYNRCISAGSLDEDKCTLRRSASTVSFYYPVWAAGRVSCWFSLDIRLLLANVRSQTNILIGQNLYRNLSAPQHLRSRCGSGSGLQLDQERWTNVNGRDSSLSLKALQHKLHFTEAVSGETGRTDRQVEHELYKLICVFNINITTLW